MSTTLLTTLSTTELRQLAQEHHATAIIIFLNTPPEILRQRQNANQRTKHRHSVPQDKIQAALARFELPTSPESVIEFTPDTPLKDWLRELSEFQKPKTKQK